MEKIIDFHKRYVGGYKLSFHPEANIWQLKCAEGSWKGSLKEIWQKMHWEFEIENKEIRYALSEMEKNMHFVADFGIWGTFICTYEKDTDNLYS